MAGGVPPPAGIVATKASFGIVRAVAVDPSGRTHISADECIFRLDPGGILTRVAGAGMNGYNDGERPALEARLGLPASIAFDAKGNLYFSEWGEVRSIDSAGTLRVVLPYLAD